MHLSKHTCGGLIKLSEPIKVTYNKTESITIQVPQELRGAGKLPPHKYAKKKVLVVGPLMDHLIVPKRRGQSCSLNKLVS